MAASSGVRVRGLRELTRAFKEIPEEIVEEMTWELLEAANPVKMEAQDLAVTQITNMPRSPEWAAMKLGVSRRQGVVWMAPALRGGRGRKRPNLADLLMGRSMEPALEHNQDKVVDRIDDLIDRIADNHGF